MNMNQKIYPEHPTDLVMCNILNDLDSKDIATFKNDSLDVMSIFNSLIEDTAAFLVLSNKNDFGKF